MTSTFKLPRSFKTLNKISYITKLEIYTTFFNFSLLFSQNYSASILSEIFKTN